MRTILSVALIFIICIIYFGIIDLINELYPFAKQDISIGICLRFGAVFLFVSLLICMLIHLLIKSKIVLFIPYLISLFYWVSFINIMPYRTWVYMFLSIFLIGLYNWCCVKLYPFHSAKSINIDEKII